MVPVGMTGEEVTPVALPVAVVASVAPVTVEAPVPVAVPEAVPEAVPVAASVPVEAPVETSTLVVLAVGWRCRSQYGLMENGSMEKAYHSLRGGLSDGEGREGNEEERGTHCERC